MRVKIGPYKNFIGPYQIAECLCFWAKPEQDKHGFKHKPDWVHDFGTWLAEKQDGSETLLARFCKWVESKRKRTVKVKIDPWDTWSMDHTLAYIILPMLRQLKATKHGAPFVDDEDVPSPLRSTAPGAKDRCEEDWDLDDNFFLRWDWIIGEIIFAFEHKLDDTWEDKFFTGEWDMKTVPVDNKGEELYTWEPGERHTYKCDYEGMKAVQDRIQNGFRLFGKYYSALWD